MKLFKLESFYNPFGIGVSGRIYEIDSIVAFDNKDEVEVAVNHCGWFGSNNNLKELIIDCDCILKRKVDFSSKTAFIISKGEKSWAGYNQCTLYIPTEVLDLKKSIIRENDCIHIYNQSSIYKDVVFQKIVWINANAQAKMRKIRDLGNALKITFNIADVENTILEMQQLVEEYKAEVQRVQSLSTEELLKEFNK